MKKLIFGILIATSLFGETYDEWAVRADHSHRKTWYYNDNPIENAINLLTVPDINVDGWGRGHSTIWTEEGFTPTGSVWNNIKRNDEYYRWVHGSSYLADNFAGFLPWLLIIGYFIFRGVKR